MRIVDCIFGMVLAASGGYSVSVGHYGRASFSFAFMFVICFAALCDAANGNRA